MDIVRNVDLKNANKLKVLNLIKDKSPISRADIAVELNFSRSTVSQIIEELLDKGWIEELGYGESTERGGKRPILLQIKKEGIYLLSNDLKRQDEFKNANDFHIDFSNNLVYLTSKNSELAKLMCKLQ